MKGVDIGPRTIAAYRDEIERARTAYESSLGLYEKLVVVRFGDDELALERERVQRRLEQLVDEMN